ncbi:hypothetical protein Dimus_028189 [Dionaea muscipula]
MLRREHMSILKAVYECCTMLYCRKTSSIPRINPSIFARLGQNRAMGTGSEPPEMRELIEYLENLKNYEKLGMPRNAGTDSDDGFDLGRMRRLMDSLGNPQSKYKVVHIAGTKGKGSTAAFVANILREAGYSVGCYTSPHVRTIRERMSLGLAGDPISANELLPLFHGIKRILDKALESEYGYLSHFEVFTAIALTLFAEKSVDIAVVEAGLGGARDATNVICSSGLAASVITTIGEEHLAALGGSLESIAIAKCGIIKHGRPSIGSTSKQVVIGGPFLPHIEEIIRDKASSMCSPVISASDPGNRSAIKCIPIMNGKPRQSCHIVCHIEEDIPLTVDLPDVKLLMLGNHQLQNAVTATCTASCLNHQGWSISDAAIRAGLERTQLLGRSQFLTPDEAKAVGSPGSVILLDGAHTKESAKALVNTIRLLFLEARLVLVVAMASDKDHVGFAREFLSAGHQLEAVCLTEVDVAGDKHRTTPASVLKDCWFRASKEQDARFFKDLSVRSAGTKGNDGTILVAESSLTTCLRIGGEILEARRGDRTGKREIKGSPKE